MRVESLDLNLIVALEAIVRLRSVSAAAQELRLTQPALSRALSRLREHFGDQLAVPVGRRMAPTAFGAELFARATELLHETRAFAQQRPGFSPAIAVREFTVAASDYVSAIFLTKVFRKLASAAPGLSIISSKRLGAARTNRGSIVFVWRGFGLRLADRMASATIFQLKRESPPAGA
jgi:LysR family nod box-dependent transcriptional activator